MYKRTEEILKTMSNTSKNNWNNPEYRDKMIVASHKRFQRDDQIKMLSDAGKKAALAAKGGIGYCTGKKHSEETKKKRSESMKRACMGRDCSLSEETKRKMSVARKGYSPTEETKKKISESHKGDKSHWWKGGISFEPYCQKFNKEFKERVRAFFGHRCVGCGIQQTYKKLSVHHVNYEKMVCCNDVKPLFVSLCMSCHMKTNFNREHWELHFTSIINERFGGMCY